MTHTEWDLCHYRSNREGTGWFKFDRVELEEWPEKGDIVEVEDSRWRITWLNLRNRALGVVRDESHGQDTSVPDTGQ